MSYQYPQRSVSDLNREKSQQNWLYSAAQPSKATNIVTPLDNNKQPKRGIPVYGPGDEYLGEVSVDPPFAGLTYGSDQPRSSSPDVWNINQFVTIGTGGGGSESSQTGGGDAAGGGFVFPRGNPYYVIDPNASWTTFTNQRTEIVDTDDIEGEVSDLTDRQQRTYNKWKESSEGKAAYDAAKRRNLIVLVKVSKNNYVRG